MGRFDERTHEDNLRKIRAGQLRADEVDYTYDAGGGCFQHLVVHEESCPDCRARRRGAEAERRVWDAQDELVREQRRYDRQNPGSGASAARRTVRTAGAASASASGGAGQVGPWGAVGALVFAFWAPLLLLAWVASQVLSGPVRSYTAFVDAAAPFFVVTGLLVWAAGLVWRRHSGGVVLRAVGAFFGATGAGCAVLGVSHGFSGLLVALGVPVTAAYLVWRCRAADGWLVSAVDQRLSGRPGATT